MGIMRQALLWASGQAWLGEQFRKRSFAKRATARFIPGETLDEAMGAAEKLRLAGMDTLISKLGENVNSPEEAQQATEDYLQVLDRIHDTECSCFISLKPTQIGLDLSDDLCCGHLLSLVQRASELGTFIWIDMESSAYVERTIELFEAARGKSEKVGICVQSCLLRCRDDLERLIANKAVIRMVKGAYREPTDVAMQSKKDVDESFLELSKRMIDAISDGVGGLPVFGTHDMRLLRQIIDYAETKGVGRADYEIQMLYGIGREHQKDLVADGHRVRILVAYGTAWFPWYMRRLAERPANVWFVVKSIFTR